MSTVTLKIGAKSYTVACGDGEEAHIAKLGSMIDAKFTQMGDNLAPQEVQNFLFASLILADEVHEAQKASDTQAAGTPTAAPVPEPFEPKDNQEAAGQANAKEAELRAEIEQLNELQAMLEAERDALAAELKTAKEAAQEAASDDQQTDMFGQDVFAARLEALASQAEACAEALEGSAPNA
ncbi:MAG: cell division protein ZapA [Pseudomonadota bacterium]